MKERIGIFLINDVVVIPNSEVRIECDKYMSDELDSLLSQSLTQEVLVANPIINLTNPNVTDIPSVMTLALVKLRIDIPNGKSRIVFEGLRRCEVTNVIEDNGSFFGEYRELSVIENAEETSKYANTLKKNVEKYINKIPYVSNAIFSELDSIPTLSELTDIVCAFLPLNMEKKKKYIPELDPIKRSKMLVKDMKEDVQEIEIDMQIDQEVEQELNKTQREYFLREKMKVIQTELGDVTSKDETIDKMKEKLKKMKCSLKVKERIKHEIERFQTTSSQSPEQTIIRDYLDWMLNLPWNKFTKDSSDLDNAEKILDETHYGLEDVKERILEYLAVKQNTNNLRSPILCLVGPPGVGKTTLAVSIAKALSRKYVKMSVGGINDEAEIVGHRRTYVGANPGRIIQGMKRAGSTNPVFIIDEIDKMSRDLRGDPASALLEVLDPEQNSKFSDHYIEEDFDLSKVMFIATANYVEQIPYELRDRLEIINISSYTEYEKLDIAKTHLIPKELEEHGLTSLQVQIEDDAILTLIRNYTKEAGVRELERIIATLFRKIVKKLLLEKDVVFYNIDNNMIEELLGKKKFVYMENNKEDEVGVVNGMAYTVFGGDILPIEANLFSGKGNLVLTGSLGDVMQESCHIALDYIKSNMKLFEIDSKLFDKNDIHIHVPEGAVNKDGPSAGVTITTTLISLFTNKKVSKDIAMTGEITLRGRVLGIGGLKEKVIGAHRAGIKTVYIPKENERDLDEIPDEIKNDICFIAVNNYEEIFKSVFESGEKNA